MADERDGAGAQRRRLPAGEPRAVGAAQPGPAEAGAPLHGRAGRAAAGRARGRHQAAAHSHAAAQRYLPTNLLSTYSFFLVDLSSVFLFYSIS